MSEVFFYWSRQMTPSDWKMHCKSHECVHKWFLYNKRLMEKKLKSYYSETNKSQCMFTFTIKYWFIWWNKTPAVPPWESPFRIRIKFNQTDQNNTKTHIRFKDLWICIRIRTLTKNMFKISGMRFAYILENMLICASESNKWST